MSISFSVDRNKMRRYNEFYNVALFDYISARTLLRFDLLPQGAGLAASSVEKILKAFLALRISRMDDFHGHLQRSLWNSFGNFYKELYANMDLEFIRFLKNCYALRYADNVRNETSVIISKYKTLAELDRTMYPLLSAVNNPVQNKNGTQTFKRLIELEDSRLFEENFFLKTKAIKEYFDKPDVVYEVTYLKNYGVVQVHKKLSRGADEKSSFLIKSSTIEKKDGGIEGKV